MPATVTPEQIELLRRFDTPTICNAVEELNIRPPTEGFMGPDVHCLLPHLGVMVGFAVTAKLHTSDPQRVHNTDAYWQMFENLEAGAKPGIIVAQEIDPRPGLGCVFGDGMATMATRLGGVGIVSNSAVRDLAGIRGLGFHVFASGLVPAHANYGIIEAGTPVVISSVTIAPGDIIHGDENGIVVFPADAVADVIQKAEGVQRFEAGFFAYLRGPDFSLKGLRKRLEG